MDWLFGQSGMQKLPTMNPQQKQILQQLMQMLNPQGQVGQGQMQGNQYLQDLMNPNSEAVNQFTQPYMNQFNQQTVPGLAERFAGMGAQGGGLSSSGFGQALGAAGANLQTNLAALKAGLGQQAAGQLMSQYGNMTGQALGAQPFGYASPQQGFIPGMLGAWGQQGFPGAAQGMQAMAAMI